MTTTSSGRILYHGTSRKDWTLHVGACLTDDPAAARHYGPEVYTVAIDGDEIEVDTREWDRDQMVYPGDKAAELAAWATDGYDLVTFEDETPRGRQHQTWRICRL